MSNTLFERLGKRESIAKIVDDVVENHMNNPAISARFLQYKELPEQLAAVKQHTIDFFSAGSGGPAIYSGRQMPEAHKGMNISPEEYMHAIDDIFLALNKHSIDEETKKDVLSILWSLKGTIIAH